MNWDKLLVKHYDKVKTNLGIDLDVSQIIDLTKETSNGETLSTEFLFDDTLTNLGIKLRNSSVNEIQEITHQIFEKIAEANNKKKDFGEVFTKISGWDSSIRKAFRKNPAPFLSMNSKFCEVSYGLGNCIKPTVEVLMETLRSKAAVMYGTGKKANKLSDDELRTHILDNMIYGVELQEQFAPLTIYFLDPKNQSKKLHKHLYQGNSLLFDYIFDGESMMGKFDVVYGNPPYGVLNTDESSTYAYSSEQWANTKESKALHTYFIRLASDLLKHGGLMLYVTRASVLVTDNTRSFREEILKKQFDVNLVWIPQKDTLYSGAQTTGMFLMATKKDELDARTPTTFIRFIHNVEYECEYTIKDTDEKIPMLWDERSIAIWEYCSSLSNRFKTSKGIVRAGNLVDDGDFTLLDAIGTDGPNFKKTNFNKESKRTKDGISRTDTKVLVSTGCTDALGERLNWLEGLVKDENGEFEYTANVCGIANVTSLDHIESILTDPVIKVYGSLIRTDRNTSSAFYKMMSYDYDQTQLNEEVIKWAKEL